MYQCMYTSCVGENVLLFLNSYHFSKPLWFTDLTIQQLPLTDKLNTDNDLDNVIHPYNISVLYIMTVVSYYHTG